MERKIGEIFEYNGEWYQCINTGNCSECAFTGKRCYDFSTKGVDIVGDCSGRTFKKLEKVGESYEFQKRTIQTYNLYTEPFISVDMNFIWAYLKGSNTIDIIIKQDIEDMEEKNNGNTPLNVLTDKYVNGDICYDDFEKEVKALYSCKEEIKPTLKGFDLEAAKLGKPVCTRDGRKARIICFDSTLKNYPLVVLVGDYPYSYTAEGKFYKDSESCSDLMMLPEKKEGWVNVYNNPTTHNIYTSADVFESKEIAEEQGTQRNRIATCKITWEE